MLLLASAAPLNASTLDPSGNLDTSFGPSGLPQFNVATVTVPSFSRAVVALPGGGVIVGGGSNSNGLYKDYVIQKLDASGNFDGSFGTDGGFTHTDMGADDQINAMAVNSTGTRICGGGIAGPTATTSAAFGVACYTANGILDPSFSGDGIDKSNPTGVTVSRIEGMTFDRDDKLIVVGWSNNPAPRDWMIRRYNTDGTPDTNFGTTGDGWIVLDWGGFDRCFDVAMLYGATHAQDRIVVVGSSQNNAGAIAIFTSAGVLDTASNGLTGTTGKFTGTPGSLTQFRGVAIEQSTATKYIVVTGQGATSPGFIVARYALATGAVNVTGNLGSSGNDVGWRVKVGANDLVYASGTINASPGDFRVVKMTPALGTTWAATTDFGGSDFAQDLVIANSGDAVNERVTAVGGGSGGLNSMTVARYLPNGGPDTAFSGDGKYEAQLTGGSADESVAFAVQSSDGKAVVAGTTFNSSGDYDLAVTRVNTDGTRDSANWAAGTGGWYTHGFTAGSAEQVYPGGVAIDGNGKAIVVGTSNGYFAERFTTSGAPDTSFDTDGIVLGNWGTNSEGKVVAIDASNNVIVGGDISLNGDFKFSRLAASNGAIDATFGSSGTATVDISAGRSDVLKAIAIDPSGKIVAGGACVNSSSFFKMCLARLNSNGTLDTSFNTTGKVFLSSLSGNDTFDIRSLQLLPDLDTPSATDYKIVVAGQYVQSSPSQAMWLAARFNMNGSLDTSFNSTGYKTFPAGTSAYVGSANSVALQYDEKLVIVGESSAPDPLNAGFFLNRVITVARLNWDGSLDTTYGTNGFTYTSFSSDPSEAHQAYVYPQSNATLKGRALLTPFIIASDFAMNRYLADPAPIAGASAPDLAAASDTGRSTSDNVTNDTTPTFTGTCSQGETVYLLVNGANTQPRTRQICPAGGTYSLTPPALSGVPRTVYTFTTLTQSGIGDSAASAGLSVTIDAEINPAVVINNPTAGSNQLPNPTVDGTSEAVASVVVTTDHPKGGGCAAFLANGDSLGVGTGNWTCASSFKQGPHNISVVQTDLAGNLASAVTRSFSVKVPTTTTIVSSVNPSKYGQSVTFTATVTPGANADLSIAGTNVRFVEGVTTLATVALNGSGQATYTPSGLGLNAGLHTIQAVYDENADWLGSSAQVVQDVQKADTATAVASAVNPSVFGQSVTFTAAVTAVAPGAGTPDGTVTFLDGGVSIGTGTLNGSGVATFSTSALAVGNHTITASYGGSSNYNGSSGPMSGNPQVVNKANTATAVTSSLNPSIVGQSVTFTATVTAVLPGAGTPSGTVTFLDGGNSIGTGALNGSGVATLATSALAVGNHTITTNYIGDGNFFGSTGSLTGNPQVVNKKPTTTTLTSSQNPAAFGQSVTFTATVAVNAPHTGTPTGTVTFLDGGSSIGTGNLNGAGVATFSTSALAVGNHTITASYGADANFDVSTGSLTGNPQVISKANTSTAATSSANPSVFGQSVTFTATVAATAPGAGTPGGTVGFLDGGSPIGSGVLSGGVATFTTSTLALGNHTITTSYSGDGNFNTSTGSLTGNPQVVNKANTTTGVISSQNPSVFGQTVTFTATVSAVAPGGGAATGTVTFLDGINPIGTGALSGGVATFTTTALAVGDHTITTTYPGDTNFNGSLGSLTGNPQVVDKADTTTAVTSSQNPSVIGQAVTFTATVTATSPGSGTPSGSVTFLDGGNAIGTGALDGSGVATFTTSTLTLGSHSITTNYAGDSSFNGSTGSLTGDPQVVSKNASMTALASSANPSVFGQSVTFTATVAAAPPGSGTPTGTVTFLDGGSSIGTGPLSGGVATFTTSALAVGNHTITADYGGDTNFDASSGLLTGNPQVVNKADTTTSVTSSQNPSLFGQSLTFTATVASVAPGAGTATGSVTFLDGGSPIGTGILSGGVATFTTSALLVGNHTITTSYGGDGDFNGSTGSLTGNPQAVNKANTTTTVASSQNPSVFGQSVTLTATLAAVAPGAGLPSGTVTFLDGGSSIGTGTLSGGIATFTTSALAIGNHTITTDYPGDGDFNGSAGSLTGNPQVVNKADTTTALTSSLNPSVIGQSVMFTATVSPTLPGVGTPTGTVQFLDGVTPLGPGALSGGVATFSTSTLTLGNHTITANYSGDGNFKSDTGALTGNPQVVNKPGTAIALTSSLNPSTFGQAVMFTATVTVTPPGSGTPTGTVSFLDGGSSIGTGTLDAGGIATLTTSALTAGSHTITASYGGDANFNSSSGALTGNPQVVNKADTTAALASSGNPSTFGQSVTFTATLSVTSPGAGAPTGIVTFLDGGSTIGTGTLSGGVATFSTSTLIVGNHTITVSYGGDANFNGASTALTGNPQAVVKANTTSSASSSQNPSVFGQPVTFTATLAAVAPGSGAPTGSVTFLDGGNPIGSGTLNGSGVATFTTSALAIGNHTITTSYAGDGNFNGSSGALTGNPQVVGKAGTVTITLLTPPGPITVGSAVQITATVTASAPGAGTPTGSVTFLDGASPLGTVALSGGSAAVTMSTWTVGSHSITSSYAGDANFKSSVSAVATLSVTPPTRTITASAGVNGSITPSTQYIVAGNTATFTVTPANGFTAMMGTTCPEGLGTLNNNVYTTRAISVDCAVTATFASASATLNLLLTDNRMFVHYGGFINYIVTLSNSSSTDATGLTISGSETSPSSDLDTANGHWQCFGTAAECSASGNGAFFDGNVTVRAHDSVTWIVSIPKRADPPDDLASYAVTVGGTTPALMQFDTDIFVIFRDSFDVPNGDGAQSVQPDVTATENWEGSTLALALPPATDGAIQVVFDARTADRSGFHVEQFSAAEHWLRVVTVGSAGEEQATAWTRVTPVASLWLGTVGAHEKRELVLFGGEAELDVPIAPAAAWQVYAARQGQ